MNFNFYFIFFFNNEIILIINFKVIYNLTKLTHFINHKLLNFSRHFISLNDLLNYQIDSFYNFNVHLVHFGYLLDWIDLLSWSGDDEI